MEDGRYWPPVLVLILAVVALFGFRYMEEVDVANAAYEDAKLALAQTRESLDARKAMWATVEAASAKLAKAQEKQNEILRMQDEAEKKERLIGGDLKYTLKSFSAVVEKIRADAVGCEIPEIVLLNGTTLKNAKIRKVDYNTISLFHASGISSVPYDQLPKDLVEKFDLGPGSLIAQLEQLEDSIGTTDATAKNDGEPSPELQAVRRKISQLDIKINTASVRKDKLEAEAQSFEYKACSHSI